MFFHFLIEISPVRSQIYSKGSNHSLVVCRNIHKVQEEIHVHASTSINRINRVCFGHEDTTPEKNQKSHHNFLVHASVELLLLMMIIIIITIMLKNSSS